MINKRLFGTPITGSVRQTLEYRQGDFDTTTSAGDSISTVENKKPFRMDDKTPFVRMWVSIKSIQPGDVVDITKEEQKSQEFRMEENNGEYDVDPEEFPAWIPKSAVSEATRESLEERYGTQLVVPVKEPGSDTIIGYSIKKERDQINFARKIYEVGNHTYQEKYGEVGLNESIGSKYSNLETSDNLSGGNMFRNELEKNKYIKPQSGITSLSVETEGSLGVIKKTTVNFVVHNFQDYDEIFNKYFLKPGATIWVDYGWSDIPYLYRPEELISNPKSVKEFLYGEINKNDSLSGFITKNEGKVDVIQGIVTDYNSKILENGSVECSLTLTSSNNALLGLSLNPKTVRRIKKILQRSILYLGIRQLINTEAPSEDLSDDLLQLQSTPGAYASATEIDEYEKNLKLLAIQQLSGKSGPDGNSVRTGVFVDNITADNVYIAWGLFEDLIINSQFGFGMSKKDIEESKNTEITMNSSTSFTKWSKLYVQRQRVLLRTAEDPPVFLFPDWWGNEDPERPDFNKSQKYSNSAKAGGSYSYQKEKFPLFDYEQKINKGFLNGNIDNPSSGMFYKYDKIFKGHSEPGRIPLREVFVNVNTIIEAFEKESTIKKAIEQILDDINGDSDGFFNWSILSGEGDSQLKIIDKQYTVSDEEEQSIIGDSGQELFTFKVMSPKSIVKDYNLEFKLPSGNIGNMYAIQGMSHGNALFTTDSDILDAAAINATYPDNLSIIYEPDNGSLRAEQLLDSKGDASEQSAYEVAEELFSTSTFNTTTVTVPNLIPGSQALTTAGLVEDDEITQIQDTKTESDDLVKKNDRILELKGYKVASSFRDYFKIKIINEVVSKNRPTLLPYNLSLTTYGIASIQPGDTFQVDYLPKNYLDTTYLQTTKVSHEIGPGGWFTSLETQFRLKPKQLNNITVLDRDMVRLSPVVLNKQNFEELIEANDGWFNDSEIGIKDLSPYMTHTKIVDRSNWGTNGRLDYVLKFQCTKKLSDIVGDAGGDISHYDTSFWADWGAASTKAANSVKNNSLTIYASIEWYDWLSLGITAGLKKLKNYVMSGEDAYYKGLLFRQGLTGYYLYPPHVKLEPGKWYYMMVRGSSFGFSDPNISDTKVIRYFDDYIGTN
tara:strand:+ start:6025 stop:9375 length:3351 start_codon:yes stop_codon:yes gene_type:complete